MVLTIKHRFSIYRRFKLDIWGLSFSFFKKTKKLSKFFYVKNLKNKDRRFNKTRRYIYRIDIIDPQDPFKWMKKKFITLRLIKLYYLTLKYRHFRLFASKAGSKDGLFEANFCFYLECRLVPILYRSNFITNMFEIIHFVKKSNVLINGICINYLNYTVSMGDFITFSRKCFNKFKINFKRRFILGSVLFNTPRFIFVSYKLFLFLLLRLPFKKDLIFPIRLDIYRATAFG